MPETAVSAPVMAIREDLSVTEISPGQAARSGRPAGQWTAEDFRAYVSEEISRIHGPQLPCRGADAILEDFWQRHGAGEAVRITRAAFELFGGMWMGAPVTVRRFMQSNDEFFAQAIVAVLGREAVPTT